MRHVLSILYSFYHRTVGWHVGCHLSCGRTIKHLPNAQEADETCKRAWVPPIYDNFNGTKDESTVRFLDSSQHFQVNLPLRTKNKELLLCACFVFFAAGLDATFQPRSLDDPNENRSFHPFAKTWINEQKGASLGRRRKSSHPEVFQILEMDDVDDLLVMMIWWWFSSHVWSLASTKWMDKIWAQPRHQKKTAGTKLWSIAGSNKIGAWEVGGSLDGPWMKSQCSCYGDFFVGQTLTYLSCGGSKIVHLRAFGSRIFPLTICISSGHLNRCLHRKKTVKFPFFLERWSPLVARNHQVIGDPPWSWTLLGWFSRWVLPTACTSKPKMRTPLGPVRRWCLAGGDADEPKNDVGYW